MYSNIQLLTNTNLPMCSILSPSESTLHERRQFPLPQITNDSTISSIRRAPTSNESIAHNYKEPLFQIAINPIVSLKESNPNLTSKKIYSKPTNPPVIDGIVTLQ